MFDFIQKQFRALKTSENHLLRKAIGVLLVVGGLLGFLPVLGFWMLPLGLALLAVDYPIVRRVWRRTVVWWGRRRHPKKVYRGSEPPNKRR
jgi:hypothetical protein